MEVGTLAAMKGASVHKSVLLLAVLMGSTALPAAAGILYKCEGTDGVPNYVSKRIAGASCEVVSRYTPDRRASRASVSNPPAPAPAPTSSGTAARGAVLTETASASTSSIAPAALAASPAGSSAGKGGNARRMVSGHVYSYVKDGVRHYSSVRPRGGASVAGMRTIKYSYIETCFACAANPGVNFGKLRLNTAAYQAEIAAASRQYGVEEAIVRAIIHAESSFNPMALSHAGAQGLMQLMPPTARRFGVSDSYDPSQNIRGGVQYLAWLLKRFNGNLTLAAAGYNAGEGAVDRHGGVPPYRETQRYVERVAVLADRYRGAVAAR